MKVEKHTHTHTHTHTQKCRNNGKDYPHKNSKCPAEGVNFVTIITSKNILNLFVDQRNGKQNKKTEHNIDNNSSSSDDETGSNLFGLSKMNSVSSRKKKQT